MTVPGVGALADRLAEVRQVKLPFPWPFVEPETAHRWILDFAASPGARTGADSR